MAIYKLSKGTKVCELCDFGYFHSEDFLDRVSVAGVGNRMGRIVIETLIFMRPDALTFQKTSTSDIEILLSGLSLGTLSRDQFVALVTDLVKFKDGVLSFVDSPVITLPSRREQERIILASSLPESNTGM